MRICPICDMVVTMGDDHIMYPLEQPYMNLLYHLKCWQTIKNESDLNDIVHKHAQIEYNRDKDGTYTIGKTEKNKKFNAVQGHVRR